MSQMLLFQDPRPLVERLGVAFFRQAPERPGVYLMCDGANTVLYVGKAKNLRKRLASYRVANPDRLPRRHLRLLRAVERIDLHECPDETAALAREAELLRRLRPRFNRAGTWPGTPRFLSWRVTEEGLALAVNRETKSEWHSHGPMGAGAVPLRAALVRLLWCALEPERRLWATPVGWLSGRQGEVAAIPRGATPLADLQGAGRLLNDLFAGQAEPLTDWVRERTATQTHPVEVEVREQDLETVTKFAERQRAHAAP
jgi:predicted GIY-YIG superfamily endonuclease